MPVMRMWVGVDAAMLYVNSPPVASTYMLNKVNNE